MSKERTEQRKKEFKKTTDTESARRKREQFNFSLRKSQREDTFLEKRRTGSGGESWAGQEGVTRKSIENLPTLVMQINSEDPLQQFEATTQFRRILAVDKDPPITEIIAAGVVPRFVLFLTYAHNPKLQFEAAWALTNIASGSSEQTRAVMEAGAVSILVNLAASSPSDEVKEQAIWTLGNIAGDSHVCRDYVLQKGALTPILTQLVQSSKFSMLRNATWSLSNLCRGKPAPNFNVVRIALPVLARLIHCTDQEVLADACWALSYLSDGDNTQIQTVIDSGICDRVVQLLAHPSSAVQTPALRVIGNIVSGDDDRQTDTLIKHGVLPHLLALLSHPKKVIKKECCWTISNITAGTKQQIQAVFDANIVPPLIKLLGTSEFDVKKEAAWAVSNAASGGNIMQIKYLVSQGAVKPLCDLLSLPDNKIVLVALEAVEGILKIGEKIRHNANREVNDYATFVEEAEGLDKIEALQKHPSEEIYKKAVEILEKYFDAEEDQNMMPGVTQNGYAFNTNAAPPSGGYVF